LPFLSCWGNLFVRGWRFFRRQELFNLKKKAGMDMQKVVVVGAPGSGKSVLSGKIAQKTGLPLVHLDALYWKPGWVKTPPEEWEAVVREQAQRDSWIIDGNFGSTLELRIASADTVIFLDVPRTLSIWGAVRRRILNLGRSRPDMGPDCVEKLDKEFYLFLKYIWNFRKISRGNITALMEKYKEGRAMITLASRREAAKFLQSL
jgi:adenylate kinase family enzyme